MKLALIITLSSLFLASCGGGGLDSSSSSGTKTLLVSAGNDQIIQVGYSTKLKATISNDENTTLNYAWRQVSGETVTLNGANTAEASFTPTQVPLDALIFELTVTDNSGKTYTDQTLIKVIPTSYNNFVNTHSVYYDGDQITRCTTTSYTEEGTQYEHYEYLNPGVDGECFTDDDSELVTNKSYTVEFETPFKGVRHYLAEDLCEKVDRVADYPYFSKTLSMLESCDSEKVVQISIDEFTMTNVGEISQMSIYFGSDFTIWPGNPSNPASVDNPVKYLAFDSYFDQDGHTMILFVMNDLRGEDGIYMTEDDVLAPYRYIINYYDEKGVILYQNGFDVGPDRTMQTGDDFIVAQTVPNYGEDGLFISVRDYGGPGPDNDWSTFDDNDLDLERFLKFLPLYPVPDSN